MSQVKYSQEVQDTFAQGNLLFTQKKYEDALHQYEQVLSQHPDYIEALNNKGLVLRAKKQFKDALEVYDKVLNLKPECSNTYYNKGMIYKDNKDQLTQAIEMFDKAFLYDKQNALALYNKGLIQQSRNQLVEAAETFTQALHLDDKHSVRYNLVLGDIYLKTQQEKKALEQYREILQKDEYNFEAYRQTAQLLSYFGDYETSLRSYERAIKIQDQNKDLLIQKSIVLSKLNKSQEAATLADQVLRLHVDDIEALYAKAFALKTAGDPKSLTLAASLSQQIYQKQPAHILNKYLMIELQYSNPNLWDQNKTQLSSFRDPENFIQPKILSLLILWKQQKWEEAFVELQKLYEIQQKSQRLAYVDLPVQEFIKTTFDQWEKNKINIELIEQTQAQRQIQSQNPDQSQAQNPNQSQGQASNQQVPVPATQQQANPQEETNELKKKNMELLLRQLEWGIMKQRQSKEDGDKLAVEQTAFAKDLNLKSHNIFGDDQWSVLAKGSHGIYVSDFLVQHFYEELQKEDFKLAQFFQYLFNPLAKFFVLSSSEREKFSITSETVNAQGQTVKQLVDVNFRDLKSYDQVLDSINKEIRAQIIILLEDSLELPGFFSILAESIPFLQIQYQRNLQIQQQQQQLQQEQQQQQQAQQLQQQQNTQQSQVPHNPQNMFYQNQDNSNPHSLGSQNTQQQNIFNQLIVNENVLREINGLIQNSNLISGKKTLKEFLISIAADCLYFVHQHKSEILNLDRQKIEFNSATTKRVEDSFLGQQQQIITSNQFVLEIAVNSTLLSLGLIFEIVNQRQSLIGKNTHLGTFITSQDISRFVNQVYQLQQLEVKKQAEIHLVQPLEQIPISQPTQPQESGCQCSIF